MVSPLFYLMAAGVTLTFGSFVYLAARPDLYHVPLMAANMFTAAGIWLWLGGLACFGLRVAAIRWKLCLPSARW